MADETLAFIGKKVRLISASQIRYEGILCEIHKTEQTISVKNVRSFGTEGRRLDGPPVPASDKTYDFIVFRASDIQDLSVEPADEEPVNQPQPVSVGKETSSHHPAALPSPFPPSFAQPSNFPPNVKAPLNSNFPPPGLIPAHMYPQQQQQSPGSNLWSQPSPVPYWQPPYNSNLPAVPLHPEHHLSQGPFLPAGLGAGPDSFLPHLPPSSSGLGEAEAAAASSQGLLEKHGSAAAPPGPSSAPSGPVEVAVEAKGSAALQEKKASVDASAAQPVKEPSLPVPVAGAREEGRADAAAGRVGSAQAEDAARPSAPLLPLPTVAAPPQQQQQQRRGQDMAEQRGRGWQQGGRRGGGARGGVRPRGPPQVQAVEAFDFSSMNEKFKKEEVWGELGREQAPGTVSGAGRLEGAGDSAQAGAQEHVEKKYSKGDFFDLLSCDALDKGAGRQAGRPMHEQRRFDAETFGVSSLHGGGSRGFRGGGGRAGSYRGAPGGGRYQGQQYAADSRRGGGRVGLQQQQQQRGYSHPVGRGRGGRFNSNPQFRDGNNPNSEAQGRVAA